LKKINNKKGLLPFEIEEMHDVKIKRNLSKLNTCNTAEKIFTEYVLKDNYMNKGLTRVPSKNFYPCSVDNLDELITYKYGPDFRNEVYK
jgi:hypothetical protein